MQCLDIRTANVTSWPTAKLVLRHSKADVLFLQEHKASENQIKAFNAERQAQYRLHAAPASHSEGADARARSAGTAVAVRPHLSFTPVEHDSYQGRFALGHLQTKLLGSVTVASIYAPVGSTLEPGAPADNLLHQVFEALLAQRRPAVLGGRF